MLMTSRHGWRIATVFAGALVVSCGKPSGPSATIPVVTPTSPTPSQLTVSTRCSGSFRNGVYYPLACLAEVSDTNSTFNAAYSVKADLRIFGGPAEVIFPKCPACGGPPWTFDIDLRIPADMTPGVKTFPIWVTDAVNGRRADTTAAVEIVAP